MLRKLRYQISDTEIQIANIVAEKKGILKLIASIEEYQQ